MPEVPEQSDVSQGVGRLFDAVAETYDQSGVPFFQPIAAGLVDALDPRPGEDVLDIGCGRGAVTVRLADAVLPSGSVTAVDLSEEMVARTRDLLSGAGHAADVRRMDAARPDLPEAAFDLVSSSLVIFFVDEPAESLRRWVRLLRPGGRIGVTTFAEEDPRWTALDELFAPWLPEAMRDPRVIGEDSPFDSDERMETLLREAGALDVRTETLALDVPFSGIEDWRAWSMGTGQRAMWQGVPEDRMPGLLADAARLLDDARGPDGTARLTQTVRYTLGVAPTAG